MAYYNNNDTSTGNYVPSTSYAPKTGQNTYVNSQTTYINSPFDDDAGYSKNNSQLEKDSFNSSPYNPDFQPPYPNSPRSNGYSTHEHALSPSLSEKKTAGTGDMYQMQNLSPSSGPVSPKDAAYSSPYNPYLNNNNHTNGQAPANGYGYNTQSNYHNTREDYEEPHYYNGYDDDRPSLSNDTAPMRPRADLESSNGGLTRSKSGVSRVKYTKEKSRCLPCFPCIRSTCGRVTCCICLLLLLAIIALVIVVFTVFKLPTVNYQGMQSEPVFSINNGDTTFGVNLVANIEVKNPNPLGFNFESITATAYYPGYPPSIGGGNVTKVEFPAHSTKVINFPIQASYNRKDDPGMTVIQDILTRCGLTGPTTTGLTINYDLKLTVRIIGINISPTIKNQHVNLACPADIGQLANNIPGGIAGLLGGKRK
ncbi:hypothetical protein BGW38_006198 [Lunasporangiospora selenospora]|uniref:Late embryogenesis abundant protein LEA-2 subgroup domain-containing protein n=1 Tax=Lunasporangiospora selenospora TaxID=979761 RepID=A0A9P6KAZ7_9FUNG|nr:hypothetical protein BGW38_006198 [Lunasporangiospora selenospora]